MTEKEKLMTKLKMLRKFTKSDFEPQVMKQEQDENKEVLDSRYVESNKKRREK